MGKTKESLSELYGKIAGDSHAQSFEQKRFEYPSAFDKKDYTIRTYSNLKNIKY